MLSSKHNAYFSTTVWSMPVNCHRHLKKNEMLWIPNLHCSTTSWAWCQLFSPTDHLNYRWIPIGSCLWQEAYQTNTPQKKGWFKPKGRGGWDKKWMLLAPPNKLASLFQSRRSKQWPLKKRIMKILHELIDLCLWYALYRASTAVRS